MHTRTAATAADQLDRSSSHERLTTTQETLGAEPTLQAFYIPSKTHHQAAPTTTKKQRERANLCKCWFS